MYDRSTPIDKKNKFIKLSNLNLKENETLSKKELENIKIKELKKLYKNVKKNKDLNEYNKWYKNYNSVVNSLLQSNYIKNLKITPQEIDNILIAHIIEENNIDKELVNKKDLDSFEKKIKNYFNKLDSKEEINEKDLNTIYGFNGKLNNLYVSKIINKNNLNEKGSAIKNKNTSQLDVLLKQMNLPEEFIINYNLEQKQVLLELLLRILDNVKMNNKIWYLTKKDYDTLFE